jgi:hypothetical protein
MHCRTRLNRQVEFVFWIEAFSRAASAGKLHAFLQDIPSVIGKIDRCQDSLSILLFR